MCSTGLRVLCVECQLFTFLIAAISGLNKACLRTLKNMRLSFLSLCDPSVVPATLSLLTGFLLIFLNKFLNARFSAVYGWHLFRFSVVVLAVCSGLWCYLIRHEVRFHTTFMAIGF